MPRPTPLQDVERVEVVVEPEPDERSRAHRRVRQPGAAARRPPAATTRSAWRDVEVDRRPDDPRRRGQPWDRGDAGSRRCAGADARRAAVRRQLAVRPLGATVCAAAIAAPAFAPGPPDRRRGEACAALIHETFEYDPSFTEVSTPLSAVLGAARGCVPGLRPPGDRLPALARPRRPVRQRLHRDVRRRAGGVGVGAERVARLVLGVGAPGRVGRLRPDERPPARRPPRHRRLGPRLRRRGPGSRRRHRSAGRRCRWKCDVDAVATSVGRRITSAVRPAPGGSTHRSV